MERASKSIDEERNVDRLSAMPDGVICDILSFLETRRSVQTSVLAKRWRNLWAHVPVLDFYYQRKSIVNTVTSRHKVQSLNTFRLTDDDDVRRCELETCVATVVERNVQNIYLSLRVFEVPRCLLTCKTLVDLTMKNGVSIPLTAPISLPNLKKLRLWNLECEVDFTRLLFGCPVLEELVIEGTICRDPRGCYISSPTLKRLSIIDFLPDIDILKPPDYMVLVYTPALRYLKLRDDSSDHISISPCTSLVEADISIYSSYVLKFLDSVRNVKCLQLTGSCDKIRDGLTPSPIPKFSNLIKLDFCSDWRLLFKFFESADNLQVLILRVFDWESEYWVEPFDERCACLSRSLRTVKIKYRRHEDQVYNMIRCILRNALVLERMEIDSPQCQGVVGKEKSYAMKKISSFRRRSKECELHFS